MGIFDKVSKHIEEMSGDTLVELQEAKNKRDCDYYATCMDSSYKIYIEEDGSIVILGDVNSGAEVIASDNIVVLGNLRGLAHAGAKGNKQAIISAGLIDTVQIRIANIVKEIDRDEEPLHKQAYVYVQDDKIIIE